MIRRDIDKEAADWFARLRTAEGQADRAAFELWRADPAHADAYRQVERLWTAAAAMRRAPAAPVASPWLRWRWPALAAVSLAAATAAIVVAIGQPMPASLAPANTPVIAFGDMPARAIQLEDGTLALLGDNAVLSAIRTAQGTELTLTRGAARIFAAGDAGHPVRLKVADIWVSGFATGFDARASSAGPFFAVFDGALEVRSPSGDQTRLVAGQSLDGQGRHARSAVPPPRDPRRIRVDAMPLAAILQLANRDASRPILLADPGLGARTLTGTFDLSDTAALARKLAAALNLAVDARTGGLWLAPR